MGIDAACTVTSTGITVCLSVIGSMIGPMPGAGIFVCLSVIDPVICPMVSMFTILMRCVVLGMFGGIRMTRGAVFSAMRLSMRGSTIAVPGIAVTDRRVLLRDCTALQQGKGNDSATEVQQFPAKSNIFTHRDFFICIQVPRLPAAGLISAELCTR